MRTPICGIIRYFNTLGGGIMDKIKNYKCVKAYIKPNQYKELKELSEEIGKDYKIYIPMTELIRESLEAFLETLEDEGLEAYLEYRGWI